MEQEITSVNNETVKEAVKLQQKKYRDEQKKFLLEGFKPIEEAFLSKIEIEKVFVNKKNNVMLNLIKHLISERQCDPESGLRAEAEGQNHTFARNAVYREQPSASSGRRVTSLILTTEAVLKKISTTDSAPEAVAVAKQKIFTVDDIKNVKKVVLLENIKDLGNLGTILRTAKAFSQDAVILYGDTVDLYNPKCVRSAVGNLWKLPVVQIKDFGTLQEKFGVYEKVATLPAASNTTALKDFKAKSPYLIMFGSEAQGLSQELIDFSTQKVTIEMNNEVESLNLSISVGIILYEISK